MDEESRTNSHDRFERLGFKPQREIIYCKLLPYADQLDEEAVRMLAEIKANLGKSVMMREMRPGCGMWTVRLTKYIKLYGMKFSKEDHLTFIQLMYELVTIPNLEPWLVSRFAQTLVMLLKKKELISPEELVLPWKPLYNLCKRIMGTSRAVLGMYRYFSSLDSTLDSLVHAARYYFPASATQDMLDEFRSQLCPFAAPSICLAVEMMEWFLPIALPPEQHHLGHELWLREVLNIWEVCHNAPAWEGEILWLLARLASCNIGYIDWEPHIPLMFTRFLRSLNLPVSYKNMQSSRHHKLDTSAMALWIVSVLGGGSSAQKYLDKFMKALESYFHPANFGRWLMKLKDLLRKLPYFFIQRLHTERYRKPSWENQVPDSHKLTDEDIRNFVESVKPVAMQAMFSKLGLIEVSQALQHLATLCPNIIIPQIVERLVSTVDTVTEPHKFTAAMQCVVAVARPMVQGVYKEGPTHVIPLLMATLPGIDPNDIRKCFVTFQFISTFTNLIPIVDSSNAAEYWNDLTEEEAIVCRATADFEDFVLQFFDRCFTLIESSSLEMTRLEREEDKRSKLENMAEGAVLSTCTTLLMQTSSQIFNSALRKLHSFVISHILETKVSGHLLATVLRAFAKANPNETLRMFVPHLCDTVLSLVENDEVLKEENLDNELLYNLLLLSEVVDARGSSLLSYIPMLEKVLDRTLHLVCREGYLSASCILRHVLSSLTAIIPLDYRSVTSSFDQHVKDYLPVRDWGKPGDPYRMKLEWYVPGEEELRSVQSLVSKYLPPELETIDRFIRDEVPLTKEELQCSLGIIISVLGCRAMLPLWEEPPIKLIDSCLAIVPFLLSLNTGVGKVTMPDGSNVRKTVAELMNRLQDKLLQCREDDTKSFFSLIVIWEYLLIDRFGSRSNFDMHWKNFRVVKKLLEDKLVGQKRHLRALLVDRIMLQHESLLERSSICMTATHRQIMLNLLTLSTSHYSEVRSRAQVKLFTALDQFSYSYTVLIPFLLKHLQQDSNQFHEQFKGSLYVLLGPKQNPLVTRHDWEMLMNLWPAIVRSTPSEKLSVIRLIESLVECVHKHFPTITINLEIPDSCLLAARHLWTTSPAPAFEVASDDEIASGAKQLEERNQFNTRQYLALLNSLMDAIENDNLHWRYHSMALSFLRDLVHPDLAYPARVVRYFLNMLIHDSLDIRKIAIRSTLFLLKQQKRPHKKIKINPLQFSSETATGPGDRPDNAWVQYCKDKRPLTAEEWDKPRYLHKAYHGFYSWPREVEMYAPSSEQPSLDRTHDELSPEEKEVDLFFSDQNNVDKLIKYLALEEKKGKDKFNGYRFIMFKGLFRNHGDKHLKLFLPHLKCLVLDKQESSQRCAAEIIAGVIRGSKHWPFHKMVELWDVLLPIIRTALMNVTVETLGDWGICFATSSESRDPNRHHWLLELLMEDPLRDEASFIECGRLYALQGALNQQEWRISELFHRLLKYLQPFLTHQFQNVRERLGSVLTNIFEPDVVFEGGGRTRSPHISAFVEDVKPKLKVLYQIGPNNHMATSDGFIKNASVESSEERDVAIRLLKTVCKWIIGSISRAQYAGISDYYNFFPLVCLLSSYEADEELSKTCVQTLAMLGQALTLPCHVPAALKSVNQVIEGVSWCARLACLEFLQVFVFHNMAIILSENGWVQQVIDIVLRTLEDDWLEVREKAAQVLGGLLHCNFIESTDVLIEQFKLKSKTKLKKKRSQVMDAASLQMLKQRHSGILGLCAFINAYPYDVPEFVPDVFLILGDHLNDPQPIPSTIRKTLGDFKRTHHDNWDQHSLKFTEEQLAVLGDLTIPPSYYA